MKPPLISMALLLLFGRSRTWPTEARAEKSPPRNFEMVLDFVGDSTITKFMFFCIFRCPGALRYRESQAWIKIRRLPMPPRRTFLSYRPRVECHAHHAVR